LGNGGPAHSALLDFPWAVAADASNNVYIADGNGHGIRKIDNSGAINIFSPINALDLKVDSAGNIYAADGFSTVYKITPAGVATAIAGGSVGFGGDNGPATTARLSSPEGIAFDSQGNLYIADTDNCHVRKVSSGTITTVAGTGTCGFNGLNGPATSAQLAFPDSVAVDSAGNIYIAEDFLILEIFASNGLINIIAGNGSALANGPAANSAIGIGDSLTVDKTGNLYIADPDYDLVRVITGSNIRTIAGMSPGGVPSPGFSGDGGPGTSAQLFYPVGVAFDSNGFLYIADQYNQ
jgi:NHL repeat